jgi:acetyl-CoA C-acetyltransferase
MTSDPRPGETELERRHGLEQPTEFYPLFENALRARRGRGLQQHRGALGELFSPMTRVAASNPYAWFPVERSAQELTTVTARNRMIAYPYTKYLNSVLDTDQAAGVIVMSAEAAREAGLQRDRWMYWLGGAYAEEKSWFVSERADLSRSVALEACAARMFEASGLTIDEINYLDFYSCFPVAVELACEAYGIAENDPRGVTITGGLPYAGGPGSNYTTHAVAAMLQRLRANPGLGLCTGNGWYLTKHAAALFGSEPRPHPQKRAAEQPTPAKAVGAAPMKLAAPDATGRGQVEAYTVLYDRGGAPRRGIVLGRLESGERFIANTPEDRTLLEALVERELCGSNGKVECQDGVGLFTPE